MTQKCKALKVLEDARDNVLILAESGLVDGLGGNLEAEFDELTEALTDPVSFALDIIKYELRHGDSNTLRNTLMYDIKWGMYNAIMSQLPVYKDFESWLLNGCEEGADKVISEIIK